MRLFIKILLLNLLKKLFKGEKHLVAHIICILFKKIYKKIL